MVYSRGEKAKIKRRGSQAGLDRARKRVMLREGGGNAVESAEDDSDAGEAEDNPEAKEGDYGDVELEEGVDGGLFTEIDIHMFRERMREIVLPNGVSKMPSNLGESKHGSLRAAQWYSLFAFIIPLVILEVYVDDVKSLDPQSNRGLILSNIGYLVSCTNLVFSRRVSEWEANNFEVSYKSYHETSKQIFGQLGMKPNHHYALHIPHQLQRWGPLAQVSEFLGERLIGFLQKIPTNKNLGA